MAPGFDMQYFHGLVMIARMARAYKKK